MARRTAACPWTLKLFRLAAASIKRAVDGEVLVGEQAQRVRLAHHLIEELLRDHVLQQPAAVLAERGLVEARLHQAHVQEPAPEQLEVELFAEGAFTAHRVQADQQTGLEQPLGRNRRSATSAVHGVERRRQRSSAPDRRTA